MENKITALMFDLTKANMIKHHENFETMTLSRNVLNDIINVSNDLFIESPFAYQIEMTSEDLHGYVDTGELSNILGIGKDDLDSYHIFSKHYKKLGLFTLQHLNRSSSGDFIFWANHKMFEQNDPIFEIRYKISETWSSWHAIAGKFIVAMYYKYGPGGIANVYSPMNTRDISNFKSSFELRYCGELIPNMDLTDMMHRVNNDPFNANMRKIIEPITFQILLDSQIIHDISSEDSYKTWLDFEKRYTSKE